MQWQLEPGQLAVDLSVGLLWSCLFHLLWPQTEPDRILPCYMAWPEVIRKYVGWIIIYKANMLIYLSESQVADRKRHGTAQANQPPHLQRQWWRGGVLHVNANAIN